MGVSSFGTGGGKGVLLCGGDFGIEGAFGDDGGFGFDPPPWLL